MGENIFKLKQNAFSHYPLFRVSGGCPSDNLPVPALTIGAGIFFYTILKKSEFKSDLVKNRPYVNNAFN